MSDATDNPTQEADEVKKEVRKPKQQQGKAFASEPAEGEDASERAEMNRLYDETLRHLEEGEIVRGRVIKRLSRRFRGALAIFRELLHCPASRRGDIQE